MSVESAFKSTHPDVLTWRDEANAIQRRWAENMEALRSKYSGYQIAVRKFGLSNTLVGLAGSGAPDTQGWRFNKREDVWVPDKRTKAGKALAADFDATTCKFPLIPGMPDTVVHDHKWFHPGVTEYDGTIWVSWGCPADAVNGEWSRYSLDRDLWTEAPLSEFYLAKEAA